MAKTTTLYRLCDGEPVGFDSDHAQRVLDYEKREGLAAHSAKKPTPRQPPTTMRLTDQQAIKSVTNPAATKALKRAQQDNDRQRFHALTATDEIDAGPYRDTFLLYVKAMLGNDEKFTRFKSLLRYPLPSSRLVDQAADEYLKAFGAEDKFVEINLSDEDLQADAGAYLDEIHFDDFLTKNLFNQCLRASASVWIVDLPATPNQTGYARPEPMLREFGQLTDLGVNEHGLIEYVTYLIANVVTGSGQPAGKRYAVLDDDYYRVVFVPDGTNEPGIELANPHFMGRPPCGLIWHDRIDERQPLRIQSPLHALFTDLDKYVIGDTFKEHADLYASFPILWSYKSRCEYTSGQGEECKDGWFTFNRGLPDEILRVCPVCQKQKTAGPGTHIRVPQPQGSDSPNLTNPAGFINAEATLLEYNRDKLDAKEKQIREALTGDNGSVDTSTQPQNEDQISARFEARKAIISYWASHLEVTHAEILDVIGQLRYGPYWLGCAADYGTEYHLLSPAQAIADYQAARTAGLPSYQLISRRKRIDKLLAGSSETENTRNSLMAQLEPYPDLALMLVPAGSDAWELKANFSAYIDRFERENVGIEVFGKLLPLADKISTISKILYQYVNESKQLRVVPEPAGGGITEKGGGKGK